MRNLGLIDLIQLQRSLEKKFNTKGTLSKVAAERYKRVLAEIRDRSLRFINRKEKGTE